ncbi:MAG: serine/threonine protein kinase, partial [Planctomycetaceae bacterium]|nr:serine/threonine protein kinase [Planctomycetaceae bacterium]
MNKDAKSLSLTVQEKLDATCDRFEAELKAGQTPQIEEFLKQTAGKARSTLLSLLLQVEIELLSGKGKRPEAQSYLKRFPDHADAVNKVFARRSSSRSPAKDTANHKSPPVETSTGSRTKHAGQSHPASLGRFQIQKVLGEGAMGAVYLAYDPKLDRNVALKVPKFPEGDGGEVLTRFHREARSAATLNHRNICQVFEVDEQDGQHYIAMAYVEGRPLSDFINPEKPLPQRTAALIVRKVARALSHAHKQGVVHRDLKPANIMMDKEKEPVITDFGLACNTAADESRVTQSGRMLGTPAYMPLEQVEGDIDRIGPPADIYSLGVVFYELLTNEVPFIGPVIAVVGQILNAEPTKPSELRADVDPQLEAICMKAMAKQIEDRFTSMAEFSDALSAYLRGQPTNVELATASVTAKQKQSSAGDVQPSGALALGRNFWNAFPSVGKWGVGAGAAALLILLGVILFVQTDEGLVKIEVLDPGLSVTVAGKVITVTNDGKPLKLTAGLHKLLVQYEGLEISFEESFEIKKDEMVALRVTRSNGTIVVLKEGQELPGTTEPKPPLKAAEKGMVKIEILDSKLSVTVPGTAITAADEVELLNLNVGLHKLLVEHEGLEIPFEESFEIKKDKTLELRIARANGKVVVLREGQELPKPVKPPKPPDWPFDAAEAKRYQQAWADYLGQPVIQKNSLGMDMVLIPPGNFKMGARPEIITQSTGFPKEQVSVELTQPFRMSA